jgi:hypothetical protein
MNAETEKYFINWLAMLLPAVLLMIGGRYNTFMWMRVHKEEVGRLKRALVFAIAFALYVSLVPFVFDILKI